MEQVPTSPPASRREARSARPHAAWRAWLVRHLALFAGLGVLFLGGTLLSPDFLTIGNQRNVLEQVSINGILAVGMTLVILTGGIDLSVGSVLSLCSVVCAMLLMEPAGLTPGTLHRGQWTAVPAVVLPAVLLLVRRGPPAAGRSRWRRAAVRAGGPVLLLAGGAALLAWPGLAGTRSYSTLPVLVLVPLVGGMLGLASGLVIARTRLQPFIVTLAMMITAVGLAKFVAGHGGRVHSIYIAAPGQPGAPASFAALGEPVLKVGERTLRSGRVHEVRLIPIPGLFMLGTWGLAALLLHKYPLGRYIYAVGGNEETARLAGVPVGGVKVFAYTASGLLAGLAAVLFCANYKQGLATAGQMKELDAIAAVVIGGTSLMGGRGSILGTLVGIMIFGYLTNILNLRGVSSEIQDIVKGVIIVGAAVLQSGQLYEALRRLRSRRLAERDVPPEPGGSPAGDQP